MNSTSVLHTLLPMFAVLLVAVIVINIIAYFLTPKKRPYQYTRKVNFMTKSEREFFELLTQTVGTEYHIFPQVHLPSILDHKVNGQKWRPAFAHISQKSVDFVLCERVSIAPILAIELDDWSHDRKDRVERDREVERMLAEAGLPLLRLRDYKFSDPVRLAEIVR
ncbi:MAG: topoisomerase, partial [Parcubacteria group bacterium]|nr:topoisomerase [Parcubacteria group bacterium]